VEGYALESYPGPVYEDGIQAIIEALDSSPSPPTLICIGPLTNIAEVIQRSPGVVSRTRLVGMHGSFRRNYDGAEGAVAEYNVMHDVDAARAVFQAPWRDIAITPLDTCGEARLRGAHYAEIAQSRDPLLQAVIENYRIWLEGKPDNGSSSILFDTVAVHLAYSTEFLDMKSVRFQITDDGFTVEDSQGIPAHAALDWSDLAGFENDLKQRLTGDA
jgi:inosine-uridine nucleoside N-ribohydrolase